MYTSCSPLQGRSVCVAALQIAAAVSTGWFACYLNASLRLTPACELCRTRIRNVLWRNPISGFNSSSEAAHPCSCEICALCLFNQFPYFQLLSLRLYMQLSLSFLFFFAQKYIKQVFCRSSLRIIRVRFTLKYVLTLYILLSFMCCQHLHKHKKKTL